ncbi:MAG: GGDEF domain-containing protein [Lachnospiraceae bacterium]|nr:GGDEF domain-containing protein [Lachnospiraceae bacterium]
MSDYRKVIGICGTWLYEEKEYGFLSELIRMCREKGYITIAFNFSIDSMNLVNDVMCEKKLMDLMRFMKCDAVIIMGETIKSERMLDNILKTVKEMDIPVFAMEKHIDGCINIAMKFGTAFQDIVRHVIRDHGCRKINMIAGVRDNEFSDDRIRAYKEVLAENGIPFEEKRLAYGEFWDRPTRIAMDKFLAEEELPEAIICANDAMAITVCSVLRERGYSVPEDVIVTGFDGINSAKINIPSISTAEPDSQGELEILFDILERIEKGEKIDLSTPHYIDFKACPGESCGCGQSKEYLNVNMISNALNDQKWHMYALNKLLLASSDMDDAKNLRPLLNECVGLWIQHFYYVSIYKYIIDGYLDNMIDISKENDQGDTVCYNLFKVQDFQEVSTGEVFQEKELMPGLRELFRKDSGYEMIMFRLLHTNMIAYGYLLEAFRAVDERAMRRCEELGLFLSTALNTIMKNHKLILLNDRLKQINKEIEHASAQDYLTELLNRRGFYDELYRLVRLPANQNRYLTFFSIDMDGLKVINDTFGHNEGDYALKALADAIQHFARRNGICARYGGDEFVCAIFTDQMTSLTPDTVRERFQATFSQNKELLEKPYAISASIGCRCARIGETLNVEELMNNADDDMYQDKQARRKNRK